MYKVHVNTSKRKYAYFNTLDDALDFVGRVFEECNVVLCIERSE